MKFLLLIILFTVMQSLLTSRRGWNPSTEFGDTIVTKENEFIIKNLSEDGQGYKGTGKLYKKQTLNENSFKIKFKYISKDGQNNRILKSFCKGFPKACGFSIPFEQVLYLKGGAIMEFYFVHKEKQGYQRYKVTFSFNDGLNDGLLDFVANINQNPIIIKSQRDYLATLNWLTTQLVESFSSFYDLNLNIYKVLGVYDIWESSQDIEEKFRAKQFSKEDFEMIIKYDDLQTILKSIYARLNPHSMGYNRLARADNDNIQIKPTEEKTFKYSLTYDEEAQITKLVLSLVEDLKTHLPGYNILAEDIKNYIKLKVWQKIQLKLGKISAKDNFSGEDVSYYENSYDDIESFKNKSNRLFLQILDNMCYEDGCMFEQNPLSADKFSYNRITLLKQYSDRKLKEFFVTGEDFANYKLLIK
jgi:hypothetical protein